MIFNGLASINIELTNTCNKSCSMCGRRALEKEGYIFDKQMSIPLLEKIAQQVPENIVLQFHSNGDPLCYHWLQEALQLFPTNIRCFDTNGKLLLIKCYEIIDICETITISTFENDPEWGEQYLILKDFLKLKGTRKPNVIIRCLGDVGETRRELYEATGCLMADRIFHSPYGSFDYKKKTTIPEIGICLEALNKLLIDVKGNVFPCVRLDIQKNNILGSLETETLEEIWNGRNRRQFVKKHVEGKRNEILFCSKCQFWGIPRS